MAPVPRDRSLARIPALSLVFALTFPAGAHGSLKSGHLLPVTRTAFSVAPARASVQVDAAALGDASTSVAQRISSRANTQLREAEVLPAGPGDPVIEMTILPAPGGEGGYLIQVAMVRDGETVEGTRDALGCDLCTEGELVEKASGIIASLIAKIPRDEPADTPDPAPAGTADEPAQGPTETPPVDPGAGDDAKRPTALGWAGIGVGVAGLVMTGVGIPLAVTEEQFDDGGDVVREPVSNEVGYALIGVGAAAVVAGVVMLAVDLTRHPKTRKAALVPVLGPAFAGVSLTGRF